MGRIGKGDIQMKKLLLFLSLLTLLCFSSCVKESPEPVFSPENIDEKDRKMVSSEEVMGMNMVFFNDGTAEIHGFSKENAQNVLTIPEAVGNYTVTVIADEAFRNAPYVSVSLPKTVKKIGERAFQKSLIKEITFPDALTEIGPEAFDNCLQLEKVTFGKNLKLIPTGCFFGCKNLTELNLAEGLEIIEEEAFASLSALKKLTLPSTLKRIGDYAFWNSGAQALLISVPASVEKIGEEAFAGNQKHSFTYAGENSEVKIALGLAPKESV